jgi:hypothetical protein
MSIIADLKDVRGGLTDRFARLGSVLARATAVPLLVRGVVWFAGAAAVLLALPADTLASGSAWLLFGLVLVPAALPRTPAVTVVILVPVVGWVVSAGGYGQPEWLLRLVGLASALYLQHTAAALAAHLPYDAIVSPDAVLRWFARSGLVLLGTAVVAVYALVAADLIGDRATLVATVVGLAVAVGVAALLVRHIGGERRQHGSD